MAEITLDGARVTLCALTIPRVGAWVADLDVDSAEAITGRVSLVIDGATWSGTVARGGLVAGSWRGRIVGGAGGLSGTLGAVAQRGSTLGTVLADALLSAGETLSGDAHDLGALANLWHRIAAPASTAVADVARAAGYSWRVFADGSVWLGADAWATYTPAGAVDVIDEQPEAGRLVLAGDTLGIVPGVTLALTGRDPVRVGQVEHRATPSDLRTVILTDGATGLGGVVDAVIRRALRRVDYLALYPARVVSQSAAGLLDLVPDDARVPSCGGVPIRYGLPGVVVTVPAGARVLLGYEAGDPSKPVATLWDAAEVTRITVNGGSAKAAREGHATHGGSLVIVTSSVLGPTAFVVQYVSAAGVPQGSPQTITLGADATVTLAMNAGRISEGSDVLRLP